MNVQTVIDGDHASLTIEGRLSVTTSPDLESEVEKLPATVSNIDFYLADLEYISSAGLRVLVTTQKIVTQRGGTMVLHNPNDEVFDVLDMTGLVDVFTIER
ncbi:MAG: STAS domain-containing protein [Atopobiaceae bacterium]|nr:STAS domain-containing protein [Atopobiaceae bacterium]